MAADGEAARKLAAELEEDNQDFLEHKRKLAEEQKRVNAAWDSWDAERIKDNADIELMRLVKEEVQDYTEEQRVDWLNQFTAKKKKMYLKERRRKPKVLKPPTAKEIRVHHQQYLKNVKGYLIKHLTKYSDDEVAQMYEKAKRQNDSFIPMELEYQLKVPKKGVEQESVKAVEQSSSKLEQEGNAENDAGEGSLDDRKDKERLMAFTVVSKRKEPEIINAVPLAGKHPIISYRLNNML